MKVIKEREKIINKSTGFHKRQLNFLKWSQGKTFEIDEVKVIFKADKFIRHVMDLQINIIADKYPEAKQFL